MAAEVHIPLFDLIACISETVDLMSPAMYHHQMQVAYIAYSVAGELGWADERRVNLLLAGAFHDMGAFSLKERTDLMEFEVVRPHRHARVGAWFLAEFPPFAAAARLVRYHHVPWHDGAGLEFEGEEPPLDSHLLHLADRISVLANPGKPILYQAQHIRHKIAGQTPRLFAPELVEAFGRVSLRDGFWLDLMSRSIIERLRRRVNLGQLELDLDGLYGLANLFRRLIDFRSRFTATHSSGVAASAMALAELAGFSEHDARLMEIAGYFHDLGKLAIPTEILQKPARLDEYEYDIMRSHVYYTHRILEPAAELDTVRTWGALHQEYLDGTGYPFRYTARDLPQGSRIVAIADVFTALTENRPYRQALPEPTARQILQQLADDAKLDSELVALLQRNFRKVNDRRAQAQATSEIEYNEFAACLESL